MCQMGSLNPSPIHTPSVSVINGCCCRYCWWYRLLYLYIHIIDETWWICLCPGDTAQASHGPLAVSAWVHPNSHSQQKQPSSRLSPLRAAWCFNVLLCRHDTLYKCSLGECSRQACIHWIMLTPRGVSTPQVRHGSCRLARGHSFIMTTEGIAHWLKNKTVIKGLKYPSLNDLSHATSQGS